MPRLEKTLKVSCKQGLHARPAAMFVQIANKFAAQVWVRKGAEEINGKSIMGILMLGADHNAEIVLTVEGPDADLAFQELEAFIAKEI
ncbi:MAG: HPr family phosphocarrier protein [Candidatus Omnitrophica bacterium]|nr:HPr family phosphocarrier protein [Candidatus Omnitrophota bacterium]